MYIPRPNIQHHSHQKNATQSRNRNRKKKDIRQLFKLRKQCLIDQHEPLSLQHGFPFSSSPSYQPEIDEIPLMREKAGCVYEDFREQIITCKEFTKIISAMTIGKNLPDHVFLSTGLPLRKDMPLTNEVLLGDCYPALQVLRLTNEEQDEFSEEEIEPWSMNAENGSQISSLSEMCGQQDLRLEHTALFPRNPCSKLSCAPAILLQGYNYQIEKNRDPFQILISCSDSIQFHKYCGNPHFNPATPILTLSLEALYESRQPQMPLIPIPTSFDFSDLSVSPHTNFYATYMNGYLGRWDIEEEKPISLLPLSGSELFDVSMCKDTYAVTSSDGRVIMGCDNCQFGEISQIKLRDRVVHQSQITFNRVQWLSENFIAASALIDSPQHRPTGKTLKPLTNINQSGILALFDIRYLTSRTPYTYFETPLNIHITDFKYDRETDNLHYLTGSGEYEQLWVGDIHEKFGKIRDIENMKRRNAHLYCDAEPEPNFQIPDSHKYRFGFAVQNICVSEMWRAIAADDELYILKNGDISPKN